MPCCIWQVSGGPTNRSYANIFLKHGVALIGPGDSGPWRPDRDDEAFDGGCVRRFATEVQPGDVFLLRTGVASIRAVILPSKDRATSSTKVFGSSRRLVPHFTQ